MATATSKPGPTNEQISAFVKYLTDNKVPVRKPDEGKPVHAFEYERSAATSNLLYRFSRPGCVILPTNAEHVRTTVIAAKKRKIPMTIKNGGHSFAGFSTASNVNAVLMDLSNFKKCELNKEEDTVTVKGGALWGHAYKLLVNRKKDGWVVNGGRCPTVGVSGFTLGGGLGPFTRRFGMGCDSLTEATIVVADGTVVTVRENEDTSTKEGKDKADLFWALRGAGGANFGVVVEMKTKLQKLHYENVVAGKYTWYPDSDSQMYFLETMNRFYMTDWLDETTIDTSWLCAMKTPGIGVRFTFYHDGLEDEFDKTLIKEIADEKLAEQLNRRSIQEASSRFLHETLVAQWKEEAQRSMPDNKTYQIHVSFVIEKNEDQIRDLTKAIAKAMKNFRKKFEKEDEKALFQVTFIHAGGQAKKAPKPDTSFHWRASDFQCYMLVEWEEKWLEADMNTFAMETRKVFRDFSIDQNASYVNFCDPFLDLDEKDAHEKAYYGPNVEKLRQVKDRWDPDDFFNWSHGITSSHKTTTESSDVTAQSLAATELERLTETEGETQMVADTAKILADTIAAFNWQNYTPPATEDFLGANGGTWYATVPMGPRA